MTSRSLPGHGRTNRDLGCSCLRVILPLLLCIQFLLCSACSDQPEADYSTPQKTFDALVQAAKNRDSEAYADCFVEAEQDGMREQNFKSTYDETRPGRIFEKGGFTVGMEEYFTDARKSPSNRSFS